MKRPNAHRRETRPANRRLRLLPPRRPTPRVDGRVALAVLWALGRLAQRLGPAA
jgi:hypothetical protein